MPSNYTTNYKLNQWAKSDRVLMDDFNADNSKIDAAIKAVNVRVDGKADQSSLSSLQTAVSKKAEQSSLESLQTTVSKKADQSALESLQTTVSKKADQTALDSLKQTVNSHTATLAGKGNCQIHTQSYTGNGTYGSGKPNKLTFPSQPVMVFVMNKTAASPSMTIFYGQSSVAVTSPSQASNNVTWSGATVSWYNDATAIDQLNYSGHVYSVVALIAL